MSSQSRPLYRSLNSALRERFGCRVHKITLDAGLTCPNRDGTVGSGGCIYCNPLGSGTGKAASESIAVQLEKGKTALRRRYKAEKFIAYFQSFSNTYAPLDRLAALYREALDVPDIAGLAIGTRPDCVDDAILDLLAELNRKTYISVEYGLQSAHDATLRSINRGHTFADFVQAVEKTRKRGIEVCTHIILGLPGETDADMLETGQILSTLDIQAIKIHLLYVVRNTPLHRLYESSGYACLTREKYAELVSGVLARLSPSVIIHRLTGDPRPAELVAPLWALEKRRNLEVIQEALRSRNLFQGAHFQRDG